MAEAHIPLTSVTSSSSSTTASAAGPASSSTSTTDFQKKIFDYAKNYAMEKLHKKLDKKLNSTKRSASSTNIVNENKPPPPYTNVEYQNIPTTSDSDRNSERRYNGRIELRDRTNENSVNSDSKCKIYIANESRQKNIRSTEKLNSNKHKHQTTEEDYQTADEDYDDDNDDVETNSTIPLKTDSIDRCGDSITKTESIKPPIDNNPGNNSDTTMSSQTDSTSGPPVDISGYIQKKSLAQGMMDLALVSANTNQLKYILEYQENHPYFATSLTLVLLSLLLQLVVGLSLIWNTRFNMKKRKEMAEADRVNNFSVIGIFMITLINVFLSTFGGSSQMTSTAPTSPASPVYTISTEPTEITDPTISSITDINFDLQI